jgi:hypothetical protein
VQLPENYEYLGAVEKAKVLEAALKTVEKNAQLIESSN